MLIEAPFVREPNPVHLIQASKSLLDSIVSEMSLSPISRYAAEIALERFPQFQKEIAEVTELVDSDPVEIMMANISYDLMLAGIGCSTLVLSGKEGPLIARNMDWPMTAQLSKASCITQTPNGKSAGFLGFLGVISGLSERGFAVILNAVSGQVNPDGFPVMLFLRHLLDSAENFDHAVEMASDTPLAMAGLITLAGNENDQRVCVERDSRTYRQRWAKQDKPLLVTNHFCLLALPADCSRFTYLANHSQRLSSSSSPEELLQLLSHSSVRQTITAQHVLTSPRKQEIRMWVPDRPYELE
jgi:isopenicillin-N N-acyltransferase like protein